MSQLLLLSKKELEIGTHDRERNRGIEVLTYRNTCNWQWRCQVWENFPNLNNKFVIEDAQKCKIIRVLRKKKKLVKWQELLIKMSYLIKLWIIQKWTFSSLFYASLTLETGRAHRTGDQEGTWGKNQSCNAGWAQTGCHFTPVPLLRSITKFSTSDFVSLRCREKQNIFVSWQQWRHSSSLIFFLSDPAQLFTKDLRDSKSHLINWIS